MLKKMRDLGCETGGMYMVAGLRQGGIKPVVRHKTAPSVMGQSFDEIRMKLWMRLDRKRPIIVFQG